MFSLWEYITYTQTGQNIALDRNKFCFEIVKICNTSRIISQQNCFRHRHYKNTTQSENLKIEYVKALLSAIEDVQSYHIFDQSRLVSFLRCFQPNPIE